MKPGDLLVLKNRDHLVALDVAAKRHFTVPGDAIGVFLRRALAEGQHGYEFSDEYVLTHGRVLACVPGAWRPLNDAR